jgi:hypothetical protein
MSSVCDLGTIRNIIRGVDQLSPHMLLSEVIDDAEHSSSTKVFIDINLHSQTVIFGFENAANKDQLNKMVTWNPVSGIHNTSNISTCGQGLKYYEFHFRGEQTHVTKTEQSTYITSKLNSDVIYEHAISPHTSETQFSEILKTRTHHASDEENEVVPSIQTIFDNENDEYPFDPKTLIISKKISNQKLIEWLKTDDNIINLEKHLNNKYYEEIKSNKLSIYIKFPNADRFIKLGDKCTIDIIGSTQRIREHHSDFYYVNKDFNRFKIKKGMYIICINNKFFYIQPNGSSTTRAHIELSEEEHSFIFLQFRYIQYNVNRDLESQLKECMVGGTSLEDYAGIYLKIGDKFINSQPITANLIKRNLEGARFYRALLELMDPESKIMLGLQGLKPNFNISQMQTLENTAKQCAIIYKNFCKHYPDTDYSTVDPVSYCVVKTSNDKNAKQAKPGRNYIRVIGPHFYKLGMAGETNAWNRIFDSNQEEYNKIVQDFPEEEIYPLSKQYAIYISPKILNAASTEQYVKEQIAELDDVITYNNKIGSGLREYFHCEDMETVNNIIQMMVERI